MLPDGHGAGTGAESKGMEGSGRKDGQGASDNRTDAVPGEERQKLGRGATAKFERHYGCIADDLPERVLVTALTPLGERTMEAIGIWDTGATNTTLNWHFAERLCISPVPPMDDEGEPITTANMRYKGTATARIQIGGMTFAYKTVKVTDFDPDGLQRAAGRNVPDILIGMDVIGQGRFEVDSTSGETVLRFTL